DYVYVYTLLMHYTCVQNPSEYFHDICRDLPEVVQQCIAEFFKQTVNGLQLTRDCLRQTILNIETQSNTDEDSFLVPVVPESSTPDRYNMHRNGSCTSSVTSTTLSNDGSNSLSSSLTDGNKDSSTVASAAIEKTKSASLQRERRSAMTEIQICAPPTPKTELLEQRTRELLGLRAQLETERYEKTVLEEQILENESLINTLSKVKNNYVPNEFENVRISKSIHTFLNQIQNKKIVLPALQMKRRLMNELNNKDAILSEKYEQLQELRSEHEKLADKFKMSEKQVLVCMDRINELEQSLNSSNQLLIEKDSEIEYLEQDKLELQQCLQEARNELQNGREVLNASSDLLDTSQLQSSLNSTPENLAISVVDKQLREKEFENDKLRAVLEHNSQEKERIDKQLVELIFKYQLEKPQGGTPEKASEKSQSHMLHIIGQGMEQLTVDHDQEHQRVNELQVQYNKVLQQNIDNNNYINNLRNDVEKLNNDLTESRCNLRITTEKMEQSKNEIQLRLNLELERAKQFSIQIAALERDIEIQSQEHKLQQEQLEQDLSVIKASKLQVEEQLQTEANDIQKQLIQLQQELEVSRKECQEFEQIIADQKFSIIRDKEIQMEQEAKKIAEITDKCRNEKILLQHQLDFARQLTYIQKLELSQLEKELSDAKVKQVDLENDIHVNNLKMTECKKKQEQKLKENLDDHRQQLEELEKQIANLHQQLKEGLNKIEQRDEQLLHDRKLLDSERNKCQLLENQIKQLQAQYLAVEKDIKDTLAKEKEELGFVRQQLEHEKIQEQELNQKCDDLREKLEDSEKQISDLRKHLKEGLNKIEQLDEQLLNDRKLLDSERNKCQHLENQIKKQEQEHEQKCGDQKQQLEDSEKQITDLRTQLKEGLQKLEQQDEQLLHDRKLLDSERNKCQHLENQIKKQEQELKQKCDDQRQQLEESEKQISDLRKQLKEGLQKLEQRDEELLHDRKLLDSERNKCQLLENQIKQLQAQYLEGEKDIKDSLAKQKEEHDFVRQQLEQEKLQEQELKQNCDDLKQKLEESEKQLTDLRTQLKEGLQKLEQRDEQLLHDRKLLDIERNKCQLLEDQIKKQVQEHEQKCGDQKIQLEESQKQSDNLNQQLKEGLQKIQQRDEQLLHDRKLLDSERNKCQLLENQIQQLQAQYLASEKDIKDSLAKQKEEQDFVRQQLEQELKQKCDDQRQQLEESEKQISDLRNQLKEGLQKLEQRDEQLLHDRKLLDSEQTKCQILDDQIKKQVQELEQKCGDQKQQLEDSEKQIANLNQQLKEGLQKIQQRDEQLLHDRKLLDSERNKCQLLENQIKQLDAKKLADEKDIKDTLAKKKEELEKIKTQLDLTTKRLEKMAVKLGEHQAVLSKKQREINQAKLGQDEQCELIRALQNEKENLQSELRQNKERVNRAEEKLVHLEQQRSLEEAERVAKHNRIIELEKTCENLELKRVELEQQLNIVEQEKIRLSLEVVSRANGDANKLDMKDDSINEKPNEVQPCVQDVDVTDALCAKTKSDLSGQPSCENDNNQFSTTFDSDMQEQLRVVELQLSEALQELDQTRNAHESLQSELNEKRNELQVQREKTVERDIRYQRMLGTLKDEIRELNTELAESRSSRTEMCDALQKSKEQMSHQNTKGQQLELDCQILQAKYRDAKEEIGHFEQKLKDQRFEMEGKLEKMKTKMRTLYMAEVTRMKEKQESDAAGVNAELEKLRAQNVKYEEHTRKLSNQIVRLNEKILDQQKQHAVLSTKLRHLQEAEQAANEEWQPFKRPSVPSANLGSNLTMEDEEGEVFNNTYLTDLKLGRVPNMTAEELQYRNSLQPPHLKSAYAAQYDVGAQEDDLKECQLNLDDSMSALLSITGNGNGANTRKRSMGTHYKRPGPPTPSKNGGRLSFGSSEPPREVLRETYENGTAKTPARFKMFASRFSMGSSGASGAGGGGNFLPRDEQNLYPLQQHPQHRLLSTVPSRNIKSGSSFVFCTSTPRAVRRQLNYDRQRLMAQDNATSENHQSEDSQNTPHLSNAELLATTNGRRRRLASTSSAGSSGAASLKSNHKCAETPRRVSFCLHGSIFAKGRSRSKPITKEKVGYRRLQQQRKMRQKRFGCFDVARQLDANEADSPEVNAMSPSSDEHNDTDNN
ncbi:hypothetical protein KR044_010332, partial [Drosophila immigrans]